MSDLDSIVAKSAWFLVFVLLCWSLFKFGISKERDVFGEVFGGWHVAGIVLSIVALVALIWKGLAANIAGPQDATGARKDEGSASSRDAQRSSAAHEKSDVPHAKQNDNKSDDSQSQDVPSAPCRFDRPSQPYVSAPTSCSRPKDGSAASGGSGPAPYSKPKENSTAGSGSGPTPSSRAKENSTAGPAPCSRPKDNSTASGGSSGTCGASPERVPEPALSPRTVAMQLVGTRLGGEQAAKAAEKIVMLQPFMSGQKIATLDQLWEFFDLPVPPRNNFDAQDPVIQSLKSKLNRQRLLLHPDKNGHPRAADVFKYLEQCHQRLTSVFVRRGGQNSESVHQRTRREEEELRADEAKRRKQEEERRAAEEEKAREEDRRYAEEIRKTDEEKHRLESMRRFKERAYERPRASTPMTPMMGMFGQSCGGAHQRALDACEVDTSLSAMNEASSLVGYLTVRVLLVRDLPEQPYLLETNSYVTLTVGSTSLTTPYMPGCNPQFKCPLKFDVNKYDTSLKVQVFRESLGWGLLADVLMGSLEIPFLDLEEWSGCVIGRVLETTEAGWTDAEPMIIEIRPSFDWL